MQNAAGRPILNTWGEHVRPIEGVLVSGVSYENDLARARALRMSPVRARVLGSVGGKPGEAADQIADC